MDFEEIIERIREEINAFGWNVSRFADYIAEAVKTRDEDQWVPLLPAHLNVMGQLYLGYSPEWIDADFNPDGVRQCWAEYAYADPDWTAEQEEAEPDKVVIASLDWNDCADQFQTDFSTQPTHIMVRPAPKHLLEDRL